MNILNYKFKGFFGKAEEKEFKEEDTANEKVNLKNTVVIDMGASSYKTKSLNAVDTFKSCFRVLRNSRGMFDKNICTINKIDYIFGENNVSQSTETLKHLKDYEELCVYSIARLDLKERFRTDKDGIKVIDLFLLVPYTQRQYVDYYSEKFKNKVYDVQLKGEKPIRIKINFRDLLNEGLMTYRILDKNFRAKNGNILLFNIGWSTTDVFLLGSGSNTANRKVVPMAMRYTLENLIDIVTEIGIDVDNIQVLNQKLREEAKILKKHESIINENLLLTLEEIMAELRALLMRTPKDTQIVFCGGGSIMLEKVLKVYLEKNKHRYEFGVKKIKDEYKVFSDVIGAFNFVREEY